jgi:hypothetical protein
MAQKKSTEFYQDLSLTQPFLIGGIKPLRSSTGFRFS